TAVFHLTSGTPCAKQYLQNLRPLFYGELQKHSTPTQSDGSFNDSKNFDNRHVLPRNQPHLSHFLLQNTTKSGQVR
ncbi:MAG: hypothetical protein KC419_17605, partial [Anaerolineales bacterium]|nr:hypothetical protein [Anaerolineales bacterium]